MNLANQPLIDVLRLIRTPHVGPITFFQLMQRYGTAVKALDALPELSRRGGSKKSLVAFPKAEAQKEIEAAEKFGAKLIVFGAPDYPKLLLNIPDAPPVITVLGRADLWQQKPVFAMVGARNASANGCQFAQKLAREMGANGFTVASGLARGIDAFVHKGSLASGTAGVIAGGIDNIYPPENQMLYAQMKDMGAIISEQPFGAIPFAGSFPGRNRIIAGMSVGTLVVEASPKSGSLITARLAGEYGREVFAVPGSPLDPRSKGTNQLLRDGAHMVESVSDIMQALSGLHGNRMAENSPPEFNAPMNEPSENELSVARTKILEKLGYTPVSIDELIEQTGCTASAALTILLELELAGRARRSSGNKVSLVSDVNENFG